MTFEEYFEAKYGNVASHLHLVMVSIARDAWDAALASTPGHCTEGNHCVCGGDLLRVKEGCGYWKKGT